MMAPAVWACHYDECASPNVFCFISSGGGGSSTNAKMLSKAVYLFHILYFPVPRVLDDDCIFVEKVFSYII